MLRGRLDLLCPQHRFEAELLSAGNWGRAQTPLDFLCDAALSGGGASSVPLHPGTASHFAVLLCSFKAFLAVYFSSDCSLSRTSQLRLQPQSLSVQLERAAQTLSSGHESKWPWSPLAVTSDQTFALPKPQLLHLQDGSDDQAWPSCRVSEIRCTRCTTC